MTEEPITYSLADTPQRAHENGRKAYRFGVPRSFPPRIYAARSSLTRAWRWGWDHAQRENKP